MQNAANTVSSLVSEIDIDTLTTRYDYKDSIIEDLLNRINAFLQGDPIAKRYDQSCEFAEFSQASVPDSDRLATNQSVYQGLFAVQMPVDVESAEGFDEPVIQTLQDIRAQKEEEGI